MKYIVETSYVGEHAWVSAHQKYSIDADSSQQAANKVRRIMSKNEEVSKVYVEMTDWK